MPHLNRRHLLASLTLASLPGIGLAAKQRPAPAGVWPRALAVPGGVARLSLGPAAQRPRVQVRQGDADVALALLRVVPVEVLAGQHVDVALQQVVLQRIGVQRRVERDLRLAIGDQFDAAEQAAIRRRMPVARHKRFFATAEPRLPGVEQS